MSQSVFDKCLEIAKTHGNNVNIGGGEPTLHPKIINWLFQAALETIDCTLDNGAPAVWLATNGKLTEKAIQISKMAKLGMISATLSQDPWHEKIDDSVIEAFCHKSDKLEIRDVSEGVLSVGNAAKNSISKKEGCICPNLFIKPNGDFYYCGCAITKMGNVSTDEIPEGFWEERFGANCERKRKIRD